MSDILEIRNLTKFYSATAAIRNVSLAVSEGEILVILGPSGSGKSTLLKCIAGLIDPSGGQILLRGRDVTNIPVHHRNLGIVMQGYCLFPHMSAYENVAYPLRTKVHRKFATELDQRVTRMFELTGLVGLDQRKPLEMSGGQQQRVALARALVFDPDVLLLDEPLGALDRELRERMVCEIRGIHRKLGTTILYVTHDQDEAMTVADRIAVFRNGDIAQIGSPTDLYLQPTSQFVAEFLGGANLLNAERVRSLDGRTIVETSVGSFVIPPQNPPPDQQTAVMVRPENVKINLMAGDVNRLSGRIVNVAFLGSILRATLALADDTQWRVDLLPENRDQIFEPGQDIEVCWKISDTKLVHVDV